MLRRTNSTKLRRTVLMILAVTGVTVVLAHSLNAIVEHELAASPLPPSTEASADVASPLTSSEVAELADFIKNSGLFALPMESPSAGQSDTLALSAKPSLDVAKKVRLIGLVLGDPAPAAVLEDIASRQQSLFHLYEEIPDVGEIRSITRDGVVIGQENHEELLPLTVTSSDAVPVYSAIPPSPEPSLASKPFGPPSKRLLDRREVAGIVSDSSQLMKHAHLVPFFLHDKLQGFRFDFILQGGFFDKAGFQYGDVIQRVNGVEIRDPGKLLSIFSELLGERVVKVDVMRRNQPTTVIYELR